ncbi:MAG: tetratricopeptide repeat protein [Proteobacteria bacterium]|nr:tetratricopeptide repeat protein [Pseudomonadota bacterium]
MLANAHGALGHVLVFADMPQEAIPILERAIRLNPFPPCRYFHNLAWAYRILGKYEEAIAAAKKTLRIQSDDYAAHLVLVSSYSLLGQDEEARAQAAELLRTNPKYCVGRGKGRFKNPAVTKQLRDALRKAGLK